MIVELTSDAEHDLLLIGERIGLDNPMRAASFIDELLDRCWLLSEFPDRFPVALRRGRRRIRKITHNEYLIFYAIFPDRVEVERIIHAARNWRSRLR